MSIHPSYPQQTWEVRALLFCSKKCFSFNRSWMFFGQLNSLFNKSIYVLSLFSVSKPPYLNSFQFWIIFFGCILVFQVLNHIYTFRIFYLIYHFHTSFKIHFSVLTSTSKLNSSYNEHLCLIPDSYWFFFWIPSAHIVSATLKILFHFSLALCLLVFSPNVNFWHPQLCQNPWIYRNTK